MPFLNEFARAGYQPMRDHRTGSGATFLPFRAVQYGAAIAERDEGGRWLFESGPGDVNCATMMEVDEGKRPIPGWAWAWPMLTSPDAAPGAVTTPGITAIAFQGTASAMLASAALAVPGSSGFVIGKTPLDPQAARVGSGKMFGTVGRPGSGSSNGIGSGDFSSLGGYTNVPVFIDPKGSHNGFYGWTNVGIGGGGGGSSGSVSTAGQTPRDPQAARLGGARGPIGDAGQVGGAGTAFQRPDVSVPMRPIFADDYQADGRFTKRTIGMDGSFPDFHKGALGIVIGGLKEDEQQPLYFPTDPRLIANEYGSKPSAASMVCDLNGDGMVDPLRTARLHSLCRVVKGPGGGVISFGDNILALNYYRSTPDGLPGYGAFVDQGEGTATYPVLTLSAVVKATGELIPNKPMEFVNGFPLGGPNTGLAGTPTPIATFAGPVVGLMSWPQASGPITPGASKGDKHQFGVDADGHPIQSAHLACDAYFKMKSFNELDAPLEFIPTPWPKGHSLPYITNVLLNYDAQAQHDWKGGKRTGLWKWSSSSILGDGGGKPPTPKVTTPRDPPQPPPPTTPQNPVKPPPVTTPGSLASLSGASFPNPLGVPARALYYPGRPIAEAVSPGDVESRLTFAAPSLTKARPWDRADGPDREGRTHVQTAFPSILARALSLNTAHAAARTGTLWTPSDAAAFHAGSPTVGRIDAFGSQTPAGAWNYTQRPGAKGRYEGGTANGGWIILPPEYALEDHASSFARASLPASTTYFAAGPGAYFAAGYPIPTSGGIKSGVRWGISGSYLNFDGMSSAGVATTGVRIAASSGVLGFKETGGTMLDVAGIADGTYVKRVGSMLVGAPSTSLILDRKTSSTNVGPSDASEVTVYSYTLSVGALGTTGRLDLALSGTFLNNFAAAQTITIRVKLGGTTLIDIPTGSLAKGVSTRAWSLHLVIQEMNATNAQAVAFTFHLASGDVATTGHGGRSDVNGETVAVDDGTPAVDVTGAVAVVVTMQLSSSDVNLSAVCKEGALELK